MKPESITAPMTPETTRTIKINSIAAEVAAEVLRSMTLFSAGMVSVHEALGVIREEYCEYEETVFDFNLRKGRDTRPHMREELIQLAAMAIKAIVFTIDQDVESKRVGPSGYDEYGPIEGKA
jgi:isopentenyl diphosphate isomerase/L-lactate dehydrogenase-like FMN-dependent dehydrogenase